MSPELGRQAAAATLRALRGPDPTAAIVRIRDLRDPDRVRASVLMGHIDRLQYEMVARGAVAEPGATWYLTLRQIESVLEGKTIRTKTRIGFGPWDPLVTAVVLQSGARQQGTSASIGVGAGRAMTPRRIGAEFRPTPRSVITSTYPTPDLAPLLWDAAALVTETGSPSAHLFESARALGIPAVCGVRLPTSPDHIVAVDGHAGTVATIPLEDDVDD